MVCRLQRFHQPRAQAATRVVLEQHVVRNHHCCTSTLLKSADDVLWQFFQLPPQFDSELPANCQSLLIALGLDHFPDELLKPNGGVDDHRPHFSEILEMGIEID